MLREAIIGLIEHSRRAGSDAKEQIWIGMNVVDTRAHSLAKHLSELFGRDAEHAAHMMCKVTLMSEPRLESDLAER